MCLQICKLSCFFDLFYSIITDVILFISINNKLVLIVFVICLEQCTMPFNQILRRTNGNSNSSRNSNSKIISNSNTECLIDNILPIGCMCMCGKYHTFHCNM